MSLTTNAAAGVILIASVMAASPQTPARDAGGVAVNLAERFKAGALRPVNRTVAALPERPGAVRVSAGAGPGVVWIDGTKWGDGTIEVNVRGRDVLQQSFVGLAFHRQDDTTYEAVYLRPFNFRAEDPVRKRHAVQYVAVPAYDWPRLRQEFADQFEAGVDPSLVPTDWVTLRVVVKAGSVEVFLGNGKSRTMGVRAFGQQVTGQVGLWVGNNSDGDFADLRIEAAR